MKIQRVQLLHASNSNHNKKLSFVGENRHLSGKILTKFFNWYVSYAYLHPLYFFAFLFQFCFSFTDIKICFVGLHEFLSHPYQLIFGTHSPYFLLLSSWKSSNDVHKITVIGESLNL